MNMPLAGLTFGKPNINTRTQNIFAKYQIHTLQDLVGNYPNDLLDLPNFGLACLEAVMQRLTELGLELRAVV